MRIGIDCDGVLRDFIPNLIDHIKDTNPQHSDKILTPLSWDWEQWLPFWTEDETETYVFEDNFIDLFGPDCPPINEAVEDWIGLKRWAEDNGHELVLVSAQRENCEELTDLWLEKYGFDFDEIHYTHDKWSVDVDVLIDDSPSKCKKFKEKSVSNGHPIMMEQSWNENNRDGYMTIKRLSEIKNRLFG